MKPLLRRVQSQDTAVTALARAVATNSVHHAYLFEGPDGIGKELAALGLAQALVCETRKDGSADACGECSACLRAVPTEARVTRHPDVVILERALYEPARIGRTRQELADISIQQVRSLVLARAAFGPHEGRAKVFIVRRAEELSTSAANALLKTLEEPGDRTHFVLLSARANELLPTVRSRTMTVRFGGLPEATILALLRERGIEDEVARTAAAGAGGSMADAIIASDPELRAAHGEFVSRVIRGLEHRDRSAGYALAEEAKKDKGKLAEDLVALAREVSLRMRNAAREGNGREASWAEAFDLCIVAGQDIAANNSPQLVVETLYQRLADLPL